MKSYLFNPFQAVWFGLGVVMFFLNALFGLFWALRGSAMFLISFAAVLLLGWSLDVQLREARGRHNETNKR